MKKIIIIVSLIVVLVSGYLIGQSTQKLWVSIQYRSKGDRVLFIEDLETGTRCYAIANDAVNVGGYAISCVKK